MRLAVTLLVCLAGPAFADKKPPKLEPFRSETGRFRVKLADDDPKESETTVATPAGPVAVTTWRTEATRDLTLAVTVADYPEAFALAGADKVLPAYGTG